MRLNHVNHGEKVVSLILMVDEGKFSDVRKILFHEKISVSVITKSKLTVNKSQTI